MVSRTTTASTRRPAVRSSGTTRSRFCRDCATAWAGQGMPDRSVARKLSRREELGVESRRRIVEAAAALMAERGFAGTSIAAVSQRSGLPSGSIYWHFESKEALLGAVMEDGARRWFDALPRSDDLPTDPAERTAALFDAVDASLESHPEFLRLLLLIALERRDVDHVAGSYPTRARPRAGAHPKDARRFARTIEVAKRATDRR